MWARSQPRACSGPHVFEGYYNQPDETAEVMEGEWFKTGDVGMVTSSGMLRIIDRKKARRAAVFVGIACLLLAVVARCAEHLQAEPG